MNTSEYIKNRDKLYHKRKVYDNYRYKKDLPEIKKVFEAEKERFLKVSEFIEEKDNILHYPAGKGLLPVYLHYKSNPELITGIEPDAERLNVALNTFSVASPSLDLFKTFRKLLLFIIQLYCLNRLWNLNRNSGRQLNQLLRKLLF